MLDDLAFSDLLADSNRKPGERKSEVGFCVLLDRIVEIALREGLPALGLNSFRLVCAADSDDVETLLGLTPSSEPPDVT